MPTDRSSTHLPAHTTRLDTRQAINDSPADPQLPESMSDAIVTELDEIGGMLGSIRTQLDPSIAQSPPDTAPDHPQAPHAPMFAHEVNNLMTQVGGRAQLALLHLDRQDLIIKALELANSASSQVAQLAEIFLSSNTGTQPQSQSTSIAAIHQCALDFLSDEDIDTLGFTLNMQPASQDQPALAISPLLLQQVLLNLYLNAISAINRSESPTTAENAPQVTTHVQWNVSFDQCSTWNSHGPVGSTTRNQVRIIVEDNGPGMSLKQIQQTLNTTPSDRLIPSETLPHRLNIAYQEQAPSSSGHGLGLAVCQKLITNALGSLDIQSTIGQGTKVVMTLPYAPTSEIDEQSE